MDVSQSRIQSIGSAILKEAQAEEKNLQRKHLLEFSLLDWCMKNDELRNRVFRFVDVFPGLKTADQVYRHIHEYFPQSEHRLPPALRTALFLTKPHLLTKHILFHATHRIYKQVAAMFIGAANLNELKSRFKEMSDRGCLLSVDLLGEKTTHEAEADAYEKRYLQLIQQISKDGGEFHELNISVKLSALDAHFDALDEEGVSERVRRRLRRIVLEAREHRVFVHIDMEDYSVRDLTLKIVQDLLNEEAFSAGIHMGIVLQAYLKDAEDCLDRILIWARNLAKPLTIRLVRGAYWDSEVMHALAQHWPIPVFTEKADCDVMFEKLTQRILEEAPRIRLAVATHNVRSIAYAMALAEAMQISKSEIEFQLLHGMGASLIEAIKEQGYAPRIYMPMGDPVIGMAYLVRRLLENVSSQSFVRQGIHHEANSEALLQAPQTLKATERFRDQKTWGAHALLPLHKKSEREKVSEALKVLPQQFPLKFGPVIDGKVIKQGLQRASVSPSDPGLVLAQVTLADERMTEEAIETAEHAFQLWRQVAVKKRADCLRKAAACLMRRRQELMAWQIYEVGKTWREADADLVEAADFLNFYADQAESLFTPRRTDHLYQEINQSTFVPRGVCAVIAPWNFPMAILTGMTAAALVTGNTVIMKPAEQSMVCGWLVFQALIEGGIPPAVLSFLPGEGSQVGPILVEHAQVPLIAFTGSREVGLKIVEQANRQIAGQRHVKKVIVEMGGKNAAIVDSSADLDEAIPAILYSAFGFSGQKCSALSRLIVLEEIYDVFLKRLAQAASIYSAGLPQLSETLCGPVIDDAAVQKCTSYIEEARDAGKIVFESSMPADLKGYFVQPVIVADLPENSRLLKEEIFGPVLCVVKAKDMTDAIVRANQSEFALTGGLFSRTPSHIERAKQQLQVGNLYINRAITGAIVERQPFGGFKMSGGGTKAGGVNYLREFVYEKIISENVSRHGFAPMDEQS
jgi:RHH-type proline utilization regulon transcriptional repressor/proline dehydrogenase/delta 1-pyrroline-5-carboxylate dehydrogenase